jgi:precorrin-2/cobalt-factor-2 C20-methyltransferase
MKRATLYGIGVGPGDPELITVKGAAILARCRRVFVPKARTAAESLALNIAERYVGGGAEIRELLFPMTADREELSRRWGEAAEAIIEVLAAGEDACFLTLGDPLMYSTYIYLLRELRARMPDAPVVTVPGVTAFSAAAALAEFAVGEGKSRVTVVPAVDDLDSVRRALAAGGTVVLMKIGKRLPEVLGLLEEAGVADRTAFVSRAGLEGERVETGISRLRGEAEEAGYLSIILVHAGEEKP